MAIFFGAAAFTAGSVSIPPRTPPMAAAAAHSAAHATPFELAEALPSSLTILMSCGILVGARSCVVHHLRLHVNLFICTCAGGGGGGAVEAAAEPPATLPSPAWAAPQDRSAESESSVSSIEPLMNNSHDHPVLALALDPSGRIQYGVFKHGQPRIGVELLIFSIDTVRTTFSMPAF